MEGEPFSPPDAKKRIRKIIAGGQVAISGHARDEMAKDNLTDVDVVNVLRGGVVEPGEFVRGTFRYRVWTPRIYVVVAFRSEEELRVVTAWRNKP